MDLTNYLPPDLIGMALAASQDRSILDGPGLSQSERLTLASVAIVLEGGAKLIKTSLQDCESLKRAELKIRVEDYAQPYRGLGVILPGPLFGATRDRIVTSVWEPGRPFLVTCFGERPKGNEGLTEAVHLRIEPRAGMTIEEYITAVGSDHLGPAEMARVSETIPIVRIVLNLCRLAVERGVRELPLDARAEKRRRRARSDERMARLAARDAQEVIIQDLDLIVRASAPTTGEGDGSEHRRQRKHRRRGHWKTQAYGPGRSLRKRIFVQDYLVHADDDPDGDVQTILS